MTDELSRWTRAPLQEIYAVELLLPSFGIGVTQSDPSSGAIPAGGGLLDLGRLDSGDAFSASYLCAAGSTTADQAYMRLDLGYLRRVLLRILDGEEYQEVVRHHDALKRLELRPELPKGQWPTFKDLILVEDPNPRAQVRITDLRLAKDLNPVALRRELKMVLEDLQLPVTTDNVTRWKDERLRAIEPSPRAMTVVNTDRTYYLQTVILWPGAVDAGGIYRTSRQKIILRTTPDLLTSTMGLLSSLKRLV